jgi:hypothetical protein
MVSAAHISTRQAWENQISSSSTSSILWSAEAWEIQSSIRPAYVKIAEANGSWIVKRVEYYQQFSVPIDQWLMSLAV